MMTFREDGIRNSLQKSVATAKFINKPFCMNSKSDFKNYDACKVGMI